MTFITLTGADDSINPMDLLELSKKNNGLVEWGILYSESQNGIGRYPHKAWIRDFIEFKDKYGEGDLKCALHVCGAAVKDLLKGVGDVSEIAPFFDRIQINFIAKSHDINDIKSTMRRMGNIEFITQFNANNQHLHSELADIENHAILFDSSGGRGLSPESWPTALEGIKCGFAGGLGPDNLEKELFEIHSANKQNNYWVDMEGKIRNAYDKFDLALASKCIEIASAFQNNFHHNAQNESKQVKGYEFNP